MNNEDKLHQLYFACAIIMATAILLCNTSCGKRITIIDNYIEKTMDCYTTEITDEEYETIGYTLTCGNKSVDVMDGTDGQDVDNTEVIELCKDTTQSFTEVVIRIDNEFIAFYQGKEGFLTKLEDNTCYRSTDGHMCSFCLTDGVITR